MTKIENAKALAAKIERLQAKMVDTPAVRRSILMDRTRDLRVRHPQTSPAERAQADMIDAAIHRAWRKLERLQA